MKIIRNNTCYIELEDVLYLRPLLTGTITNNDYLEDYPSFKFLKFKNDEIVDYFKETQSVIDYDSIYNLTDEEINDIIRKTRGNLNEICSKWLDMSSIERKKLDKSFEYTQSMNDLRYKLRTLNGYISNRQIYDDKIKELVFTKDKVNVKTF